MSAVDGRTEDELVFASQDLRKREKDLARRADADLGFVAMPREGRSLVPAAVPTFNAVALEAPVEVMSPRGAVAGSTVGASPAAIQAARDAVLVPAPAAAAPRAFAVSSSTPPAAPSTTEVPWLVRETEAEAQRQASRRGWTARHAEDVDRLLGPVLLRLREEAVEVAWCAAWSARAAATRPTRRSAKD